MGGNRALCEDPERSRSVPEPVETGTPTLWRTGVAIREWANEGRGLMRRLRGGGGLLCDHPGSGS